MLLIGLAVWLVIAGLYVGCTAAVASAFVVVLVGGGSTATKRVLFALLAALALSPVSCALLYVPVYDGNELIKPRYLESFELAYALPFVAVACAAWCASALVVPRKRSSR